jgi:predicted transcriptional regulator
MTSDGDREHIQNLNRRIRALESENARLAARANTLEDVIRRAAEDETGLMSRTICRAAFTEEAAR